MLDGTHIPVALFGVPASELPSVRGLTWPHLEAISRQSRGRWEPAGLWRSLMQRDRQAWFLHRAGTVLCLVVTQVLCFPSSRETVLLVSDGTAFLPHAAFVLDNIASWARDRYCRRIIMSVPDAMSRRLPEMQPFEVELEASISDFGRCPSDDATPLRIVGLNELESAREDALPHLVAMCARSHSRYLAEELWRVVLEEKLTLWRFQRAREVRGVILTEMRQHPGWREAVIFGAAGRGVLADARPVLTTLAAWGMENGAARLTAAGRPGWARALPGMQACGTVIRRELA